MSKVAPDADVNTSHESDAARAELTYKVGLVRSLRQLPLDERMRRAFRRGATSFVIFYPYTTECSYEWFRLGDLKRFDPCQL